MKKASDSPPACLSVVVVVFIAATIRGMLNAIYGQTKL